MKRWQVILYFLLVARITCPVFAQEYDNCVNELVSQNIQGEQEEIESLQNFYKEVQASKIKLLPQSQYINQYRVLQKILKKYDAESFPLIDSKNSYEFLDLLKKVLLNPKSELSNKDIQLITSEKSHMELYKAALLSMAFADYSGRFIKGVLEHWQGMPKPITIHKQRGFWNKSKTFLKSIYNGPIRGIISLALPRLNTPVDKIFKKMYQNNGNYQPTYNEWKLLREFGATKTFINKRSFMKSRPTWSKIRRFIGKAAFSAYLTAQVLVVNQAAHTMTHDYISVEDYVSSNSPYQLQSTQVRLINETVPFPHLAIQMGESIYSYGQTHLTVKNKSEYLRSADIKELFAADNNDKPEGLWNKSALWVGNSASSVLEKMGPRSVQMVTLNLTEKGYNRLRRFLELSSGKAYRNQTFIMDCATMIKYAINDSMDWPIPTMLDTSPSMMNMYFAGLKTLNVKNNYGQPLVGDVIQATHTGGGDVDHEKVLLRNMAINNIESQLIIGLLPINSPPRAYMYLRYGENGMQDWQPGIKEQLISIGSDSIKAVESGLSKVQLDVFREGVLRISALPNNDPSKEVRANRIQGDMESYFFYEMKKAEEMIETPNASLSTIITSGYQYYYLDTVYKNLLATLKGQQIIPFNKDNINILQTILEKAQ